MKTETEPLILVVEDEIVKRVVLRRQLGAVGRVEEAKSVEHAEALIGQLEEARTPINVAVIDLRMPDREGFDPDAGFRVNEKLAKTFPHAQAIILTVRNDAEAWARAKEQRNIRFFFTKPWESAKLRAAVSACIEGKAHGLQVVGQVEGEGHE